MIITHKTSENEYENIENVNRIENIKEESIIISFSDNSSDVELDFENVVVIRQ